MERETGSRDHPIWLIGDSNPKNWETRLHGPLDTRHPTRHNIWPPILENVQSHLYASIHKRLRTDDLYIRNAVEDSSHKPHSSRRDWLTETETTLEEERTVLSKLLICYTPKLVFSFGAFAFEFTRRSLEFEETSNRAYRLWTTEELGREFKERMGKFSLHKINLVPLLHASIARGKFLESHAKFTDEGDGNYFDHVGKEIAKCLIRNRTEFPFW